MIDLHDLLGAEIACLAGAVPGDRLEDLLAALADHRPGRDVLATLERAGLLDRRTVERLGERRQAALARDGARVAADLLLGWAVVTEDAIRLDEILAILARLGELDEDSRSSRADPGSALGQLLIREHRLAASSYADLRAMALAARVACADCGEEATLEALQDGTADPLCPACGGRPDLGDLLASCVLRPGQGTGASNPSAEDLARRLASRSDRETVDIDRDTTPSGPGPRASSAVGQVFGSWEVLEPIARGGVGAVYRARHVTIGRIVALKVLLAGDRASERSRERFRREAEAAARLRHPNIVPIHDFGVEDGQLYLIMEYVEGTPLEELVAREEIDRPQVVDVLRKVADALDYAHGEGIVHRDVKPANVIVDAEGEPHVTDFGLARMSGLDAATRLTRTGVVVGTPAYMAPEQIHPKKATIDGRTDVYALGAVLYEILGGQPPFSAKTLPDLITMVHEEDPVPPSHWNPETPEDLEAICLRALRKEPARRYATAGALADDLARYRAGEPVEARSPGVAERVLRTLRRRALPLGGLALGLATLALLLPLLLSTRGTGEPPAGLVEAAASRVHHGVLADLGRARVAGAQGAVERALRAAEAAVTRSSDDHLRRMVDRVLDAAGTPPEQRARATAELVVEPALRAEVLASRGRLLERAGRSDERLADLAAAYRAGPTTPAGLRALLALGDHLVSEGRVESGLGVFRRAAARLPADAPLRREALERVGEAECLLGRPAVGRDAFEAARRVAAPGRTERLEARTTLSRAFGSPIPVDAEGTKATALDVDGAGGDELVVSGAGERGDGDRPTVVLSLADGRFLPLSRIPGREPEDRLKLLERGDVDGDGRDDLLRGWELEDGGGLVEVLLARDGTLASPSPVVRLPDGPRSIAVADFAGSGRPQVVCGLGYPGRRAILCLRGDDGRWRSDAFFPLPGESASDVHEVLAVRASGRRPHLFLGVGPWNHWEAFLFEVERSPLRLGVAHRERYGPIHGAVALDPDGSGREVVVFGNDPTSDHAVRRVFGADLEELRPGGLYLLGLDEAGEPVERTVWRAPDLPMDLVSGSTLETVEVEGGGLHLAHVWSRREHPDAEGRHLLDLLPVREGSIGPPGLRVALESPSGTAWSRPVSGDFDGDGSSDLLLLGRREGRSVARIVGPRTSRPARSPALPDREKGELGPSARLRRTARDLLHLGLTGQAAEVFRRAAREAASDVERAAALRAAARARARSGEADAAAGLLLEVAATDPEMAADALLERASILTEAGRLEAARRTLDRIGRELPLVDAERESLRELRERVALLAGLEPFLHAPEEGIWALDRFVVEDPVRHRVEGGRLVCGLDMAGRTGLRLPFRWDGGLLRLEAEVAVESIAWQLGFEMRLRRLGADGPLEEAEAALRFAVNGGGTPESYRRGITLRATVAGREEGSSRSVSGFSGRPVRVLLSWDPRARRLEATVGRPGGEPLRLTRSLPRALPAGLWVLEMGSAPGMEAPRGRAFGRVVVSGLTASAPPDVVTPVEPGTLVPDAPDGAVRAASLLAAGRFADARSAYDELIGGPVDVSTAFAAGVARGRADGWDAARDLFAQVREADPSSFEREAALHAASLEPGARAVLGEILGGGDDSGRVVRRAQAAFDEDDPGLGLLLVEHLLRREAGNPSLHRARAEALLELALFDEAEAALEPILGDEDPEVLRLLGTIRYRKVCYAVDRDLDPALGAWHRARRAAEEAGRPDLAAEVERRIREIEASVRARRE